MTAENKPIPVCILCDEEMTYHVWDDFVLNEISGYECDSCGHQLGVHVIGFEGVDDES